MPCSRGSAAVRSSCGREDVVDVPITFDGVVRLRTLVESALQVWQVYERTSTAGLSWTIVLIIIGTSSSGPWFRKSQRAEDEDDGAKRNGPKRNSAMLSIPPRPLT